MSKALYSTCSSRLLRMTFTYLNWWGMQEFAAEKMTSYDRHWRLSLKLQRQGYKYQQLIKLFHKLYRSHSDELEKFGTTLMELRSSVWLEVLVKHILLNYIFISDMCMIVFIFFLSLFTVMFVARTFSYFVVHACLCQCIEFWRQTQIFFWHAVTTLFSLPILTFVR